MQPCPNAMVSKSMFMILSSSSSSSSSLSSSSPLSWTMWPTCPNGQLEKVYGVIQWCKGDQLRWEWKSASVSVNIKPDRKISDFCYLMPLVTPLMLILSHTLWLPCLSVCTLLQRKYKVKSKNTTPCKSIARHSRHWIVIWYLNPS